MEQFHKTNLENAIYFALDILNHNLPDEERPIEYGRIKRFTDDSLGSCAKVFSERKNVAATTESGDAVLYAIANGAETVDTFSTNNFSKYFLDMKRAAAYKLKCGSLYDMFYSNDFDKNGSNKLFLKFRDNLPFRSLIFWDSLLEHHSWGQIYSSDLFTERKEISKDELVERIPFLDEDVFFDLKQNDLNAIVNAYTANFETASKVLSDRSYDLVYTSDSPDHILPEIYLDYVRNFNMTPNGIVVATSHLSKDDSKFRDMILREDGFFEKKSNDSSRVLVKRF